MLAYESTVIFSPELPADKTEEMVEKIKKLIESTEGTTSVVQQLGRKRLTYPIKKFFDGNYVFFAFSGTGKTILAMDNFYKVNDDIIRYLTVKAPIKKVVPVKKAPKVEPPAVVEAPPVVAPVKSESFEES